MKFLSAAKKVGLWTLFSTVSGAAMAIQVIPSYHMLEAKPGKSVTTELVVTNTEKIQVQIFPQIKDLYSLPENKEFTAAGWIQIDPSSFTLNTGESKKLKFTVNVPQKAQGELTGMISLLVKSPQRQVDVRITGAVYVGVLGTEKYDAQLTDLYVTESSPSLKMGFVLKNSGNVHARPKGTVRITDGKGQAVVNSDLLRDIPTFPGEVRSYTVKIKSKLEPGDYKAKLTWNDYERKVKSSAAEKAFTVNQDGSVTLK